MLVSWKNSLLAIEFIFKTNKHIRNSFSQYDLLNMRTYRVSFWFVPIFQPYILSYKIVSGIECESQLISWKPCEGNGNEFKLTFIISLSNKRIICKATNEFSEINWVLSFWCLLRYRFYSIPPYYIHLMSNFCEQILKCL